MLASPWVVRRFGLLNAIVLMMAATAFGLGALAAQPAGAAAAAYVVYMAFQWMSEPGMNTLLMNRVDKSEHSGASALNYMVAFGAQAVAAFAAGEGVSRFGYGATLSAAGALALIAAVLFRGLLRPRPGSDPA
jgi:predicted MFS family arabinose efflux permease